MEKRTVLINIFGPPGSGKSTLAAELYALLKKEGKSVELVRECIKRWAWAGYKPTVYDQIYIMNEQMREEASLYGKVEYIITDSPILLGEFYLDYYHNSNSLEYYTNHIHNIAIIHKQHVQSIINIYLPFEESIYKNEGRYSSIEESKEINDWMLTFLKDRVNLLMLEGEIEDRAFHARRLIP